MEAGASGLECRAGEGMDRIEAAWWEVCLESVLEESGEAADRWFGKFRPVKSRTPSPQITAGFWILRTVCGQGKEKKAWYPLDQLEGGAQGGGGSGAACVANVGQARRRAGFCRCHGPGGRQVEGMSLEAKHSSLERNLGDLFRRPF